MFESRVPSLENIIGFGPSLSIPVVYNSAESCRSGMPVEGLVSPRNIMFLENGMRCHL